MLKDAANYSESQSLGCIIEPPDERDFMYDDIAGGSVALPKNFVLDVPHMYQNGIDACVGFACAAAKSVQEDEKLSPRYQWHLPKKAQGYNGWGTSVSLCLKQMIYEGSLPYGTFDENVKVNREDYMRLEVSDMLKELARQYKIKSFWRAGYGANNIQGLKVALYEQKVPLVTSMQWFDEYNNPIKGYLPEGVTPAYGHAYILKGWKTDRSGRESLIFQNSWRKTWGVNGDFFVYSDELDRHKMGSFYVMTDIESDKAKILSRYKGKLIRNGNDPKDPRHYFVGSGQIAWIKNEASFKFGRDAVDPFWGDWGDTIPITEKIDYDIIF